MPSVLKMVEVFPSIIMLMGFIISEPNPAVAMKSVPLAFTAVPQWVGLPATELTVPRGGIGPAETSIKLPVWVTSVGEPIAVPKVISNPLSN